jgi:hypothetical protein
MKQSLKDKIGNFTGSNSINFIINSYIGKGNKSINNTKSIQ